MKDIIIEIRMSDLERLDRNSDVSTSDILILKLINQKDLVNISKIFEYRVGFPANTPTHLQFSLQKMKLFENDGYIKLTDLNDPFSFEPLSKLNDVFKNDDEDSVQNWIEEWREIFPKGSNSSGFRYRGDKQGCIKKMKVFLRKNNEVTKDQIITATAKYVEKHRYGKFMQQAHYFIEKNGASALLGEVESLSEEDYVNYSFNERL